LYKTPIYFAIPTIVLAQLGTVEIEASADNPGLDLFSGPWGIEIPEWDMLTSIGPISGTGHLLNWYREDAIVYTDIGILNFDWPAPAPATFQATVVPLPPAIWLFGSGLLGLVGMARRQRSIKNG
jgi:hypothetical protein